MAHLCLHEPRFRQFDGNLVRLLALTSVDNLQRWSGQLFCDHGCLRQKGDHSPLPSTSYHVRSTRLWHSFANHHFRVPWNCFGALATSFSLSSTHVLPAAMLATVERKRRINTPMDDVDGGYVNSIATIPLAHAPMTITNVFEYWNKMVSGQCHHNTYEVQKATISIFFPCFNWTTITYHLLQRRAKEKQGWPGSL